jgi:hypothetical protein
MYGVIYNDPKKFRKLPSARRIFPKRFRGFDFWTYFLCPFLKIFSTLVQIESKNNKIYFTRIVIKNESIMVTCFCLTQKVIFWTQKKTLKTASQMGALPQTSLKNSLQNRQK